MKEQVLAAYDQRQHDRSAGSRAAVHSKLCKTNTKKSEMIAAAKSKRKS